MSYIVPTTLSGILIALVVWVLMAPTKAERVAGWIWGLVTLVWRGADRRAVANKVQGEINEGRDTLLKGAPGNIIEGRARVKFHSAEEAKALLDRGDVLVRLRQHDHHAENVAHALMAYLPKAVLPRARRYLGTETMRAADYTLACAVLSDDARPQGALDVLHAEHIDPAAESNAALKTKLHELDEIDLHGWLTRVLLAEYRALGTRMFPGARHDAIVREAEKFEGWLYRLALPREPHERGSLRFEGKLMRVAVILVAVRDTIARKGVAPYRSRAKNLIYNHRFDAVYLMARDDNIPALKELIDGLKGDGRIASSALFEYPTRADFAARRLHRERAAIACLRRRRAPGEIAVPVKIDIGDDSDLPDAAFDPDALVPDEIVERQAASATADAEGA